jgi:hypothetical protein
MTEGNETKQICYLCGTSIEKAKLSDDHVPPKAFYPKDIRDGLNLQTAPSHKKCNEDYRKDEEYFQHAFLVEVLNKRPPITPHLIGDFSRRAGKPQTPAMTRRILKGVSNITPGGIHLPNGILQVEIDQWRVERIVLKIARGLFYIENKNFMPLQNAKDIRFCLNENEVPELYRLYWPAIKLTGVYPKVFSHKYFNARKYSASGKHPELDKLHLYTLLFWEAVMFCVAFEYPLLNNTLPISNNPLL